jgi:hypothetical protein
MPCTGSFLPFFSRLSSKIGIPPEFIPNTIAIDLDRFPSILLLSLQENSPIYSSSIPRAVPTNREIFVRARGSSAGELCRKQDAERSSDVLQGTGQGEGGQMYWSCWLYLVADVAAEPDTYIWLCSTSVTWETVGMAMNWADQRRKIFPIWFQITGICVLFWCALKVGFSCMYGRKSVKFGSSVTYLDPWTNRVPYL